MTVTQETREVLAHPVTKLSALVSVFGAWGFGFIDPLWTFLGATAGLWFPAIAVSAGEILPRLGYAKLAGPLLLGAAILFVTIQVEDLIERARTWYNNR
jgi:hypothetical protein